MELSSTLRTNVSNTASSVNGVLGFLEVGNQNLYGSQPSINHTFEGGNMRLIQATMGNVFQIQNQNLYSSEFALIACMGGIILILELYFKIELLKCGNLALDRNLRLIMMKDRLVICQKNLV